jgi:hypothetical protein
LLGLLVLSIISFLIGCITTTDVANGVVGLDGALLKENWSSDFSKSDGIDYNFITTFAVFFPAVTGIMAGANIR